MAKSIVPLRKEIKDSLIRQGVRNARGLHRKRLAKGKENGLIFLTERAHKDVWTVKKEYPPHPAQQLVTKKRALVTAPNSNSLKRGFHCLIIIYI